MVRVSVATSPSVNMVSFLDFVFIHLMRQKSIDFRSDRTKFLRSIVDYESRIKIQRWHWYVFSYVLLAPISFDPVFPFRKPLKLSV